MPSFINANNLQPFVDQDLKGWTELMPYIDLNGKEKTGYDARILRGLCKVYLDARTSGALLATQKKTAIVAEKILYALADRGIQSLVDQATGYDALKEKAKDNVVLFLERSLQLEPAKWVKTFSDDFFEMIFKMKGWNWSRTSKRPGVVGHYINDLVYARIAPNFLSELQKLNPKKGQGRANKHHDFTTRDYGHPLLREHLASLIALGRASSYDWHLFNQMVNKAYPRYGQSLELDFALEYDEKRIAEGKKQLSGFDGKLKQALDYNPNKD